MIATPRELTEEMLRLSKLLDEAQAELETWVRREAESEAEYRKARANAYLATSGTVGERESSVDKTTATEKHNAHLAAGMSRASLENVRSKRTQLSVLQTVANSVRAEVEFSRVGGGP